jgi:hypothetical protein
VVAVPKDFPTIGAAVDHVAEGGLVLVGPGIYKESVTVTTPGITLRGLDRNKVIIDGEGLRSHGVLVTADGVRVENLTTRRNTFYGVLFTGMDKNGGTAHGIDGYERLDPKKFPPLQRFLISHVTAYDNGLYGIYAFNSQHGSITESYASGSADSGFYVGQCQHCDITVSSNVGERNAIGFENANASDSLRIIGNRWSNNRIGMTLISSYQEAFTPQHSSVVAGNVVTDNNEPKSPAQANGGFGIGVGITGGQRNHLHNNLISGNEQAGVRISNAEDLPAVDNKITDSTISGNGVDIADLSADRAPSEGNCFAGVKAASWRPGSLKSAACPDGSPSSTKVTEPELPEIDVPEGMSFLEVPPPKPQPQLPGDLRAVPAALPAHPETPDQAKIDKPKSDLLIDRTGPAQ